MRPFADRIVRGLAVAFIAAAAIGAFATIGQVGLAWDEEPSLEQGDLMLAWYSSFFRDRRVLTVGDHLLYGGLVNAPVQLAHHAGLPLYETNHVVCVLFGIAGLCAAYWLAAKLWSPLAGLLAAVFLWLTPMYYGHSFNNSKDLPFAVLLLASMAAIRRLWDYLPDPPPRVWIPAALCFGGLAGIRSGGLMVFGYMVATLAAWLALRMRGTPPPAVAGARRSLVIAGLKIGVVMWGVLLVCWPLALDSPLLGPIRGARMTLRFHNMILPTRFAGADVMSHRLPWSYVPLWYGVTLPDFYFIAAAAGAIVLWKAVRDRRSWAARPEMPLFISLVAIGVLFPFYVVVIFHSILYDGVRHVLFMLPLMAVLAGVAVAAFLESAATIPRLVIGGAIAISLALTVGDMWRLHPFESVYFNRLSGGLPAQWKRFETDYWGQSYREAAEWLMAHPPQDVTTPIRVSNCSAAFLSGDIFAKTADGRARFREVGWQEDPVVFLATTRFACQEKVPGRVLHVVERMGVPLCFVILVDRAAYRPPTLF
jgi:hypothetical protein